MQGISAKDLGRCTDLIDPSPGCEGEAQGGRAENLDCSPVWLKEPSLSLLPGDLTAVDLFSGAGGFSLGLEMAGFRPLMGLDLMRAARDTYLANFPQAGFLLADAREVPAKELLALLSGHRPTVVTAGVPCQGFSLLGKRNPEDERNYLFLELLRFVEALEPEAVLVENVPAMGRTRSARLGTSFAEGVRRALEALGYQVEHQELLAADYGVPQMRRRLFFVALRPGSPFAWPEPPCQEPVTVWEAIGDLPPLAPGEEARAYTAPPHSSYASRMREGAEELRNHQAPRHSPSSLERIARTPPGAPFYASFPQRVRLHPDRPSPTLVAGGPRPQYYFAHPFQVRGLTVREAARLQSFPDRFVFLGGAVQERVLVGNAVPPLLALHLGLALRPHVESGERSPGIPLGGQERRDSAH